MSTNPSSVVLMGIGTSISLLLFAGVFFLIDMVIPLGRFFLWFGMTSGAAWTLMSFGAFIEDMTNDDSQMNTEVLIVSCGLSSASMSAFGYLIFR